MFAQNRCRAVVKHYLREQIKPATYQYRLKSKHISLVSENTELL